MIEIWSGSEVRRCRLPNAGSNPGSLAPRAFEVTKAIAASGAGVELSVRAIMPAAISICGLRVEKTADKVAPSPSLAALAAKDWLAFFGMGPAGLKVEQGVLAPAGKAGNVGYVQRPFSPGRYEVILRVQGFGQGDPAGRVIITAGANLLGVRDILFTPRSFGPLRIPRGPLRICSFDAPAGLPREARGIQIRIDSTGAGEFMICSIAVKPED